MPPMLATLGHPPTGERWAWESKWDGMRAIATTGTKKPELWSRNGNPVSESFPEIVDALTAVLDHREIVLDGEIVALDKGVPSFAKLQRRMHVRKPTTQLQNAALTTYYVFDVLDIDGTSTTELTYLERREALDSLSIENPRIKVPPFWLNVDGAAMLEVAKKHHLEGIIAKGINSTYQPGKRSPSWIKTPLRANTEAVVCGLVEGSGGAAGGIGSLILGAHDDSGSLVYIGNVGTGFSSRQRRELRDKLLEIERPTSPFAIAPPSAIARVARWSAPIYVCDVEYREYVGGALRHPSYKGLRNDKSADEVDLPGRH
ncbi:UNVERIFIED_ORG: bifunctional non-homologous end joining protein LigD [Nocardia globerula]|uniref:DNA ligase (ATP) n=1 Tax=Nocardia globerula TaxID=1818 RepID=A0A652YHX6_NOCGL